MSRHEHHSVVIGRRHFLAAGAAIPALAGMSLTYVSAQEPKAAAGQGRRRTRSGASRAPIPAGSSRSAIPG